MKKLRNNVQLIGRLGVNPEIREVGKDKQLVTFTMATNDYYKDKNGELQQNTEWHRLKAWGKTAAGLSKIVAKGDEIAIEGKLSNRDYEDKNGTKHYVTEIVVNEFMLIKKKAA